MLHSFLIQFKRFISKHVCSFPIVIKEIFQELLKNFPSIFRKKIPNHNLLPTIRISVFIELTRQSLLFRCSKKWGFQLQASQRGGVGGEPSCYPIR